MKGGSKVIVEPHRHEGIFVARGKEDALVTLNSTPGVAVYGENRISVENPSATPGGVAEKVEYRVWNPFRSKSKFVCLLAQTHKNSSIRCTHGKLILSNRSYDSSVFQLLLLYLVG